MRPLIAHISTKALTHNIQKVKTLCGMYMHASHNTLHRIPKIAAVIKANAYGHGLVQCARAIENTVDYLAVCAIDEALLLRQHQISCPIVLLEGFFSPNEIGLAHKYNFIPVVHSLEWMHSIASSDYTGALWLKAETGMHRLGMQPQQWHRAYSIAKHKYTVVAMHHFACADTPNSPHVAIQNRAFLQLTHNINLARTSANSAIICTLNHQENRVEIGDIVRPGLMLYGASPSPSIPSQSLGLLPAMQLESELIAVKPITQGSYIGYGIDYQAPHDGYIGVVACGYGDGYPREYHPHKAYVWCEGKARKIVGRVSMDMLTIWLGDYPLPVGTKVCLWGNKPSVDEVANWSNTISYTLLAGLTARVQRIFDATCVDTNS